MPDSYMTGAGESGRAGGRGAAARRRKGAGSRGGERAGSGVAWPRGPALDVGTERRGGNGAGPGVPAECDAHTAAGGERRVPVAGRAVLRPGRAPCARAAAARPQVRAALVPGIRAGAGGRHAAARRGGVRAPAARRGDALAPRSALRGCAGRHAVRGARPAQYVAHGAGRLPAGRRAADRAAHPAAPGRGHHAARSARAPGPGRQPRQGAASVRRSRRADGTGRGAGHRDAPDGMGRGAGYGDAPDGTGQDGEPALGRSSAPAGSQVCETKAVPLLCQRTSTL